MLRYYPAEEVLWKLLSRGKKPFSQHVRKLQPASLPEPFWSSSLVTNRGKRMVSWSSWAELATTCHQTSDCQSSEHTRNLSSPPKLLYHFKTLCKSGHQEFEIVDTEKYEITEQRKVDQKAMGSHVLKNQSSLSAPGLCSLCSVFALSGELYPHKLVF